MKKNLTFEEEKRKEFLYVLFNALFVAVCIVFVLNFLCEALADNVYARLSSSGRDLSDNIFRAVLSAAALCVPFAIYGKLSYVSVKNMFSPKKNSPFFYIFGTLLTVGASFPVLYLSEKLVALLGNFGYVTHDYSPYILDSSSENIVSMIIVSVLSAASCEFAYRGIITERFRRANTALALILPSLIAFGFSGSLIKMPYVFVSGVILSWIYMKTSSVYVTFAAALVRDLAFYAFVLYREVIMANILIVCIVCLVVAVICAVILIMRYGISTVYPVPRDDDDEYLRLSSKEVFSGLFKSFAFWIFVFGTIFTIFFFYLSNPTVIGP